MVIQSIKSINTAIPSSRIISCEFIIITHYLPNSDYLFCGDEVYKKIGERLKPIATYISGRCKVVKIDGKPKSLSYLKSKRKPMVAVYFKDLELTPF